MGRSGVMCGEFGNNGERRVPRASALKTFITHRLRVEIGWVAWWIDCLQRKSRQEKPMHATLSTKCPHISQQTLHPHATLTVPLCFSSRMLVIRLLLSLIQVSLLHTTEAASPPLGDQRAPIALTETTKLTVANHRGESLTIPNDELGVIFTDPGGPIPQDELRHALSAANAKVQTHLPHSAHKRITASAFETNTSFPETGDNIEFWVYSYGWGLSWGQLSQALVLIEAYMLGTGQGHHVAHSHELEFYIQVTAGLDVARGRVEFTTGPRAVTKRSQVATTLQLVQGNISSQSNDDLPITFNIPRSNLDIKITELGLPIPKSTILHTIDRAFTDVILNHDEMDYKIPRNQFPYAFNTTSGTMPHQFITEIRISPHTGKRISWSVLCIFYYGLRDFMQATEHFNVLKYDLIDAKLGPVGYGDVRYWPSGPTPSKAESKAK